jgi:hypothetical protein
MMVEKNLLILLRKSYKKYTSNSNLQILGEVMSLICNKDEYRFELFWFSPICFKDIGLDKKYIHFQDEITSALTFKINSIEFLITKEENVVNFFMHYSISDEKKLQLMNFF